jgi:hypothetical protein
VSPAFDQRFQRALKVFNGQVTEITQFWFAAATMNEIAKRNTHTERVRPDAILLDHGSASRRASGSINANKKTQYGGHKPAPCVQQRARRGGNAGIDGDGGNVESVTYRI